MLYEPLLYRGLHKWKLYASVVFTNKVWKNSPYFVGVINKTIFTLALVGYGRLQPTRRVFRATLAIYHLISHTHSLNNCSILLLSSVYLNLGIPQAQNFPVPAFLKLQVSTIHPSVKRRAACRFTLFLPSSAGLTSTQGAKVCST